MTRAKQKNEELAICKMFLSAYDLNIHNLIYEFPLDEALYKFDIAINLNEINTNLKLQVKVIQFHPNDKTPKQYSDEIGWVKAYKNGNKNPIIHVYDSPKSSWQTAIVTTLNDISKKNIYSQNEKMDMDLLLLLNDSSFPNDSNYIFINLEQYMYRSISIIDYGRKISKVLYTSKDAPQLLKINNGVVKYCTWIAEN